MLGFIGFSGEGKLGVGPNGSSYLSDDSFAASVDVSEADWPNCGARGGVADRSAQGPCGNGVRYFIRHVSHRVRKESISTTVGRMAWLEVVCLPQIVVVQTGASC